MTLANQRGGSALAGASCAGHIAAQGRAARPRAEHAQVTFADRRRAYLQGQLGDDAAASDPLATLAAWIDEAFKAGELEATAMALATVDEHGAPDVRFVLCKGVTTTGVRFFTSHTSAKGRQLAANPRAAVTLWFPRAERSVRITGITEQLPREEVDAYFLSRPLGSQIGAHASDQSRPIASREALDAQAIAAAAKFAGAPPTGAPADWGGYLLVAENAELWQGRADRVHDRLRFTRGAQGWTAMRLQP